MVFCSGYKTSENMTPNLEEWALLSCYTGAIVAEGDTYGVKISLLIQRLCSVIVNPPAADAIAGSVNIEALCRELQSYILDEAKAAAQKKSSKAGGKQEKYDFASVFALFDLDGQGTVSSEEFRNILSRLKMLDALSVSKIPDLMKCFDPKNTGQITFDSFVKFALDKKYSLGDDETADLDSEGGLDTDEDDDELPSSSAPPAAITQSAETDWLLWAIWKNAVKYDSRDTEAVVSELEAACTEVEMESNRGAVSDRDLWFIVGEMNLKDAISKQQFDAGTLYYAMDPKEKLAKGIDFESMCRGIVRMGRAYNSMIQQRRKADAELYATLRKALQAELAEMMANDSLRPK